MRHALRALLTSAFIATLAVAGTGAVAAAGPGTGNGLNYEMYEDWCFEDIKVLYCFEVHGRFTIVTQNNGDQIGTGAVRGRFYTAEGGQVTSATLDHTVFQTKFIDGQAQDELLISSTRVLTPGEQCVAHVLLKIDGGAVVIDHASLNCN